MNKITAIEAQARHKNRRSIFVDGKFLIGLNEDVVAELGLRVGQEICEEELRRMLRGESVRSAREDALRLLEYRQRSVNELARRLAAKGHSQDVIEEVIAGLRRVDLLDDAAFSKQWVRSRLAQRPTGRRGLNWELRRKGIPNDLIDEALQEISDEDELEAALKAIHGKLKTATSDPSGEKRRLVSLLRRRGFGWETVSTALAQALGAIENDSD